MIKTILKEFTALSGLRPNLGKSHIYFSKNMDVQVRDFLNAILGINHIGCLKKYLGVFIKENYKPNDFHFLVDKLKEIVENWSSKFLSHANR